MRARFFLISSALLLVAGSTALAQTVPSADILRAKAQTRATAEHKRILVMFDASW